MRRAVPALALVAAATLAAAAPETPAAPPAPLAVVDGAPVTDAEVTELAGAQLTALQNQMYSLKKRAVDELIARRLLEKEAKGRGISVEQLRRVEIDGKITPVTEAEKRALYEENKARLGSMAEEEALKRAEDFLSGQRTRERYMAYVGELRKKASVQLMMEPPRVMVGADDDPAKGPAGAPVTIIEFSDFQCPYCSKAVATVREIQAAYGDRIRLVYRDLPLPNHQHAAKAAEAGSCANAQGKFWEMHDRMFANQGALAVDDLKRAAGELGLDATAFAECLDSGRYAAEWQKDARDAQVAGVNSTPAFVINGRLVEGAQPLAAFAEVIDDELARAGAAPPRSVTPTSPIQ